MRVLMLGAGGMLARALRASAPQTHELTTCSHAELDVRDAAAIERAVRETRPHWLVNASGFTHVDGAEEDQAHAFAVNATAVGAMARVCREHGVGLLHFSTDYVFDGAQPGFYAEDDAPHPLNVYGASKLAGEELIRGSDAKHLIIRTQWVYGDGGHAFVGSLWQRAQEGTATIAADDQFGGCTYAQDLAQVSWQAIDSLHGTYHVANRGRVNRFMIAQRIFAACGALEHLSAGKSRDFPTRARRPMNSPLNVTRIEHALGRTMAEWTDAIDRYIASSRAVRTT